VTIERNRQPGEAVLQLSLEYRERFPIGEYYPEGVIDRSGQCRESEPCSVVVVVNSGEILEQDGDKWTPLSGPIDLSCSQREEVATLA